MTRHNVLPLNHSTMLYLWIISFTLIPSHQAMAYQALMEYYHYNHQGSLLEVYDGASNQRLLSQAWSPWGERQILHAATGNANNTAALLAKGLPVHMGYTGHKELLSTGLTFAGDTRLYDARLKRFLNSDDRTTGGVRGQNRYSYAYNNPMTFIDPDGRAPRSNFERLTLNRSGSGSFNDVVAATFNTAVAGIQYVFDAYEERKLHNKIASTALEITNKLISRVDGIDSLERKELLEYAAEDDVQLNHVDQIVKKNTIGTIREISSSKSQVREFMKLGNQCVNSIVSANYAYVSLLKTSPLKGICLDRLEEQQLGGIESGHFEKAMILYCEAEVEWKKLYKKACIDGAILASAKQHIPIKFEAFKSSFSYFYRKHTNPNGIENFNYHPMYTHYNHIRLGTTPEFYNSNLSDYEQTQRLMEWHVINPENAFFFR